MADARMRMLRGLEIVAKGGQISRVNNMNNKLFLVKSQSTDIRYKVEWVANKWSCNCPDYTKNAKPCKHVYAVIFLSKLPQIILANANNMAPLSTMLTISGTDSGDISD